MLTADPELEVCNIYTAFYAEERQVPDSPVHQSHSSSQKLRRRSSRVTLAGNTIPAARQQKRMRESFGGEAQNQGLSSSLQGKSRRSVSKFRSTEDEEAMALRLDPDFGMSETRSSRRISSLLARTELNSNQDRVSHGEYARSFAGASGSLTVSLRRGQSLGGSNERSSFKSRLRNRASTSATASRYSIDNVSFLTGADNTMTESSRADNGLPQSAQGDGELFFRKIGVFPITDSGFEVFAGPKHRSHRPRVVTLVDDRGSAKDHARKLCMYVIDKGNSRLLILDFLVRSSHQHANPQRSNSLQNRSSKQASWNVQLKDRTVFAQSIIDAAKMHDQETSRLAVLQKASSTAYTISLYHVSGGSISVQVPTLPQSLKDRLGPWSGQEHVASQLSMPRIKFIGLDHGNCNGFVSVEDNMHRRHRLQIRIRPRNNYVFKILRACDESLYTGYGAKLLSSRSIFDLWALTLEYLCTEQKIPAAELEWNAMVVTLFGILLAPFSSNLPADQEETTSGAQDHPHSDWASMQLYQKNRRPRVHERWSHPSSSYFIQEGFCEKSSFVVDCANQARRLLRSNYGFNFIPYQFAEFNAHHGAEVLQLAYGFEVALKQLQTEEQTNIFSRESSGIVSAGLTPVLAQIQYWFTYASETRSLAVPATADLALYHFEYRSLLTGDRATQVRRRSGSTQTIEQELQAYTMSSPELGSGVPAFRSPHGVTGRLASALSPSLPIIHALDRTYGRHSAVELNMQAAVPDIPISTLHSLPEAVATYCREVFANLREHPPSVCDSTLLRLLGREDLEMLIKGSQPDDGALNLYRSRHHGLAILRTLPAHGDVRAICAMAAKADSLREFSGIAANRHLITMQIFSKDRRFIEAAILLDPLAVSVNKCPPEAGQSESDWLSREKEVAQRVAMRTWSLPSGQAFIYFQGRKPMATERIHLPTFQNAAKMRPSDRTVTVDKTFFTEDKTAWAFFHSGVNVGLSIAADAKGIDTSWIAFNKPTDLGNRHAGLLLGLGLNGHLKSLAKWLAFKYLTPKHTMTSIGLLLGLAASHMGTMDTLATRLLSVHITRLLPQGAAELNLSPLTQTVGLMGIGLLYYRTQHRRMCEVMLSEIENTVLEDTSGTATVLRDEGYRLAAGLALGFINVGRGHDLSGLHDMHITERLLSVAVGSREVSKVHILDQATAGATMAIALVFMKSHNEAVARKVDIPDSILQFDYVRPDILLLRTVAKHLIMWDDIKPSLAWISSNLPEPYRPLAGLNIKNPMSTSWLPFYNILTGLCWVLALRHAGTGNEEVRDILRLYLDSFIDLCKLPALLYDAKLTKTTMQKCVDVLAVAAATVMAGTGDLTILRRLRYLHTRIGPSSNATYGSHLATHMAMGVLFMGGGLHSFGRDDLSIAALLCAFYPTWPGDVLDNKNHCQAFRHFWVMAARARCVVPRDVTSGKIISGLKVRVVLKDGKENTVKTPCLLPELDAIKELKVDSEEFWDVKLDFVSSPQHLAAFTRHQTIWLKRKGAVNAGMSKSVHTLKARRNPAAPFDSFGSSTHRIWETLFDLPSLRNLGIDREDLEAILGDDGDEGALEGLNDTEGAADPAVAVDTRLVLAQDVRSANRDRLVGIRMLLNWAKHKRRKGEPMKWLGTEVIEGLEAQILERAEGLQS